ncbi:MAG: phage terminase large subunit family protein [Gammaproteobacteria bacterium]
MDAISDRACTEVSFMAASQVGKTEVVINTIGYYADHEPSPMLIVQPTQKPMAESFSKERIAPTIAATPALRGKIADSKSRSSGNTILEKSFPGGFMAIAGANSPASLASRPIRVLLMDEVDRYPESAGAEGDPCTIAERRTSTFWNRVIVRTSSPGIRGQSRIEDAFEEGDGREYHVPCPECGEFQVLRFRNLVFDSKDKNTTAHMACEHCGVLIDNRAKARMLRDGEWRAQRPFNGHASFWISALYSPWVSWSEIAQEFLRAQGDSERLKTFTNTILSETWEEEGEEVEASPLYRRREAYRPEAVPEGVRLVTFGCDVQADRFEFEFVGWGEGEESWSLHFERLYCDTQSPTSAALLIKRLRRQFERADGATLDVVCGIIDAGYLTDEVYKVSRKAGIRWAIPGKGSSTRGVPIHSFPLRPNQQHRVYLTQIGTDTAKDLIYQRLMLSEPGPGYCHFPVADIYDEEWFEQLTGEYKKRRHSRGHVFFEWHQKRPRVEALDCRVYALAAMRVAIERLGYSLSNTPPPGGKGKKSAQTRTRPPGWMDGGGSSGEGWL